MQIIPHMSLNQGRYPEMWKKANIVPLNKKKELVSAH